MVVYRGPTLQIAPPAADEIAWLAQALQAPAVYGPLSLPGPPTPEAIRRGELTLVDEEGRGRHAGQFLIFRQWREDLPVGFLIHYGWEHPRDTTRELDLALPHGPGASRGRAFEAHLLAARFLLVEGLAKRIRWRVVLRGPEPPRWYDRLGARALGMVSEPNPVTGLLESKRVFEMTRREYEALLARDQLGSAVDAVWPDGLWERLMSPAAVARGR